jgi:3-oxoacyl-[acyl-carrier protein] reductase
MGRQGGEHLMTEPIRQFRLDGRVAVVTGGGSGIGRAVAQVLASAGAAVVIGDINDAWGEATVAGIRAGGGTAVFQHTDVTRREDLDALVDAAVRTFGGLNIQCNIAGVPAPTRPMTELTAEDLDRELGITLRAVLYGCQAAVPALTAAGGGAIVNISSTVYDLPAPGYGLYYLGKQAVTGVTRMLALELGPAGIRVNAIAPGVTLTNFSTRHFAGPDGSVDEERKQRWLADGAARSPLGLVGTPQDQALLVLYLVSDASRFVTGQLVRANGGWTMG